MRHAKVIWRVAGAVILACAAIPAQAQSTDAGKMLWTEAGCDGCHGAAGQGGTNPDLPQGPSLRASKLDQAGLVEVISCGVVDKQMPAWLMGAYTASPCYGMPVGPEPSGITVVGLYTAEQIQGLVDFIWTDFMGK